MKNLLLSLISLVFLNSALAGVFQHEFHWRESLRVRLGKRGLWNEYAAHKQRQLHGKFSNFKSVSQNVNDFEDFEYYINITIGTPDQLFLVAVDTSHGYTSVPDINCKKCDHVRKFDPSKSSTYKKTNYSIEGAPDFGVYGQDFVRFGSRGTDQLVIPDAFFGQDLNNFESTVVDGILSLGFTAQNPDGLDTPIITAINSGILDNPVVTILLRNQKTSVQSKNYGVITYGAIDTVNCDRNIIYEPLGDPNIFEVTLKAASLGSVQFSDGWNAYIDTTSPFIMTNQSIVEAFAKEAGATINPDYGTYSIDCNVKFNFNLTIGSTVYTLTEQEMIIDYGNNVCMFGLAIVDDPSWVLGYPWFRTVCLLEQYVARRQSELHGKLSNFKTTSQNTGYFFDSECYINITIGTPGQLFSVRFDTGSGLFVVPDVSCSYCQGMRRFNSSKSSTYQNTSYFIFNQPVNGIYGQDFVRLGNPGTDQLIIPNTIFGQFIQIVVGGVGDGIMGLSFTSQSPDGIDPPIIAAINAGILDNPIVTIFLKTQPSNLSASDSGMITYGALDNVNCDRNVVYEPLSDPDSFQIRVTRAFLRVNDFFGNWTANIDSNTDFILGPSYIIEAFAQELNAVYNKSYGAYSIDCDREFNLTLTIGSTRYTLTDKQMVINYKDTCFLELLGIEGDIWFLGTPWLRTVCNVFDYNNKRMGFANIINS